MYRAYIQNFFIAFRTTIFFFRELDLLCSCGQGRNEVGRHPGQEASLAPPCSNLRSFGRKFTVLKKILVTLLGLFGAPRWHFPPPAVIRRPHGYWSCAWELCPLASRRYAPACSDQWRNKRFEAAGQTLRKVCNNEFPKTHIRYIYMGLNLRLFAPHIYM